MTYVSCLEKQQKVKDLFSSCGSDEEKYQKIIELGTRLKPIPEEHKVEENRVRGCQSILYLHTYLKEGKVYFEVDSDALISKGLAYLLVAVYSGEEPETILKCPPQFLEDLNITQSLTPNRASGLYSMHLKMKQEALKILVDQQKKEG